MRAHVIDNGIAVNTIEVQTLDDMPGLNLVDADLHGGKIGDSWNGQDMIPHVVPFDGAGYAAMCEAAVQKMMDLEAQAHGYDDLRSTITYANSSVAKWKAEALNAIAWRDACWIKAEQLQTAAMAPGATLPTPEEVIAQMPPSAWPA